MRRLTAFLLSLAMMVTVLAACAQTSSPAKTEVNQSTATVAPPTETTSASDEKITLTFMAAMVRGTDVGTDARYALFDKFQADHPNVTVQDNSITQDDFNVKIKQLLASSDMPDVWSARGDMIPPAVDNDLIYNADEILNLIPGWKDMFGDGYFSDFRYKDVIWAIPDQFQGCSYLYCNMNLLNKCGVDKAPETWDELMTAISKVKAAGLVPIGMGNKGKYPVGDTIMSAICDRYTGTDWFYNMKEKKGAKFTDPEFVQALTALQALAKSGAFNPDINSLDEDMGLSLYASEKSPMFFTGAWGTDWVEANCSKDLIAATKVVIPPSIPGTKGDPTAVSGGAGWSWSVCKQVKGSSLDAAAQLIYYMTNYDYTKECLSRGYVRYPSKTPADADFSKVGPVTQQYLDTLSKTKFCPDYFVLLEPAVLEAYGNVVQEIVEGSITPEDGAKKIEDAYEQSVLNK
jgi:raffinose/stachyose/melibiose transport system substrate-binding protein